MPAAGGTWSTASSASRGWAVAAWHGTVFGPKRARASWEPSSPSGVSSELYRCVLGLESQPAPTLGPVHHSMLTIKAKPTLQQCSASLLCSVPPTTWVAAVTCEIRRSATCPSVHRILTSQSQSDMVMTHSTSVVFGPSSPSVVYVPPQLYLDDGSPALHDRSPLRLIPSSHWHVAPLS